MCNDTQSVRRSPRRPAGLDRGFFDRADGDICALARLWPSAHRRKAGRAGVSARRIVAFVLAAAPVAASGQASAIHRQPLETAGFPGNGLHTLLVRTTIDPGGTVASHVHAGLEIAYVASGGVTVAIGDAEPRHVGAGQSFQVPPRTRHVVRNAGVAPAIVVSTYIVDPVAPLAAPAP